MAHDPNAPPIDAKETTRAIIAAGVLAIVVSLIMLGNPFRAIGAAYADYGVVTPASGAPPASPVHAPAPLK